LGMRFVCIDFVIISAVHEICVNVGYRIAGNNQVAGRRIDVIADHLNNVTTEKYLVIEVETVCLQFRKVLEKIALMSLVANKKLYAKQHEKFAKHYHAERIMNDLERINPNFYPVPIERLKSEDGVDKLVEVENGYLTKEEFVKIYEKCGGMMHAQNPFASEKPIIEISENFSNWLKKIYNLLNYHKISLFGGEKMLVEIMERTDNGMPYAVLLGKVD